MKSLKDGSISCFVRGSVDRAGTEAVFYCTVLMIATTQSCTVCLYVGIPSNYTAGQAVCWPDFATAVI